MEAISISRKKQLFFIRKATMGYRVVLRGWEKWPLFADLRDQDWCVTEGSTGALVGVAHSRGAAIDLARSRMREMGKAKFARAVTRGRLFNVGK